MIVQPQDKKTNLYQDLMGEIETKLSFYRKALESDKDDVKTAKLRGRIATLKDLQHILTNEASLTPQSKHNPTYST